MHSLERSHIPARQDDLPLCIITSHDARDRILFKSLLCYLLYISQASFSTRSPAIPTSPLQEHSYTRKSLRPITTIKLTCTTLLLLGWHQPH